MGLIFNRGEEDTPTDPPEIKLKDIVRPVNDDLTISYGTNKSDRSTNGGAAIVQAQAESLQVGYSMGGATLSIAETNGENLLYNTANDKDGTTIALSLAF